MLEAGETIAYLIRFSDRCSTYQQAGIVKALGGAFFLVIVPEGTSPDKVLVPVAVKGILGSS